MSVPYNRFPSGVPQSGRIPSGVDELKRVTHDTLSSYHQNQISEHQKKLEELKKAPATWYDPNNDSDIKRHRKHSEELHSHYGGEIATAEQFRNKGPRRETKEKELNAILKMLFREAEKGNNRSFISFPPVSGNCFYRVET